MDEPVEVIKTPTITLEIYRDDNPADPRDWDNLGTIVAWHPEYYLGDYQIRNPEGRGAVREAFEASEFESLEALHDYLVKEKKALVVLPLSLYEHGNIMLYVGTKLDSGDTFIPPSHIGWDTTSVGYIFTTKERVEQLCGDEKKYYDEKWLAGELRGEIETYNQFLNGSVFGYVLKDAATGKRLDSTVWGFFGSDWHKNGLLEDALAGLPKKDKAALKAAVLGEKQPTQIVKRFIVYHMDAFHANGDSVEEVRARYKEQGYDVRLVEEISEEKYEELRKEAKAKSMGGDE